MKKNHKAKPVNIAEKDAGFSRLTNIDSLELIISKRTGGAVNIRGIKYQILCAIDLLLALSITQDADAMIQLEGIEDIDVHHTQSKTYTQIKTSDNKVDSYAFWTMGVIQHFLEVFRLQPDANFKLIHNFDFTKGHATELQNGQLSAESLNYWSEKINTSAEIDIEKTKTFLSKIHFEKISEQVILRGIMSKLYERFNINKGAEQPFLNALFYQVMGWSKNRESVSRTEIENLVQSVFKSFEAFPANAAIQHGWIEAISFEPDPSVKSTYYDGKSATPADIANGLPVKRKIWADAILKSIKEYDLTAIKSSSGQGKSTLAWQAAFSLKDDYKVCRVNSCTSSEQASSLNDFIETRLASGHLPVIVIDNLNATTKEWQTLADLLRNKPVKLIISTRNEDWARFGPDRSKLSINIIDISLSIEEAKDIYLEFKKHNKLHPSVTSWQPLWEKVKTKGLLIEYVFLLTQGQMMSERLEYQVGQINREPDAAAKLEILRLIAVADVLNIKIETRKISSHIKDYIVAGTDRNEMYRQLELEYYLKFNDKYVEGLHPVRSKHLSDILHSHVSPDETLIALLRMIDKQFVYEYFMEVPMYYVMGDDFLTEAAETMAKRTYPEIVYAIDGMMHIEPYRYWLQNKTSFDEAFSRGGLELFIHDAVPFNKTHVLENLAIDNNENIARLILLSDQLSKYNIEGSRLFKFVLHLSKLLRFSNEANFEGINFLYRWFKRVDVAFPIITQWDEARLLHELETLPISQSSSIFNYHYLNSPDKYLQFLNKNKSLILGWIKRKTDTPVIEEIDNQVRMKYIVEQNQGKINEQSVFRINIVRLFLPGHEKYCTEGITLPFPSKELDDWALRNAKKEIEPKNLGDDFDAHIHQIWYKTITDQYSFSSEYEWQVHFLNLRKQMVELVKKMTQFVEKHLENKAAQVRSSSNEVASQMNNLFDQIARRKKYPSKSKKYFDQGVFSSDESKLNQFIGSFRNFLNQFASLLNQNNAHLANLALYNLQETVRQLPGFQLTYNRMVTESFKYFPTDEIEAQEIRYYNRMLITVRFLKRQQQGLIPGTIVVASKSIEEWSEEYDKKELAHLRQILSDYQKTTANEIFAPSVVRKTAQGKRAAIGVRGLHSVESDLFDLMLGVCDLYELNEIDAFELLDINEHNEATGCLLLYREAFKRFYMLKKGDTGEQPPILPVVVQAERSMVESLEGISQKIVTVQKDAAAFITMLFNIWKLSEYRAAISGTGQVETQWLSELENEYANLIRADMQTALNGLTEVSFNTNTVEAFLKKEINFSTKEILRLLVNRVINMGGK